MFDFDKPINVDFDKPVQVVEWMSGKVIRTVPGVIGLVLMACSVRWDTQHATASVRTLLDGEPITFRQAA